MPLTNEVVLNNQEANTFLSRKLLKNSWHHFEEVHQGNLERECLEEECSWEEAREVFETDVDALNKFWAHYTGQITNSSVDNPVGLIVGIILGVIAFIILTILLFLIWKRRKNASKKQIEELTPYNRYPVLHHYSKKQSAVVSNNYETPLLDKFDSELAAGLSECYIERERLQLGEVITSGNFGDIWKGKLRMRDSSVANVAVKSLKHFDDPEDVEKFIREGVMMRGLDDKHVLSLIGVCMDSDVEHCRTSPLIILPFMKNGDLRTFLRDGNNVLTVFHLLRYCQQVALGMEYLAEKKFVHRDLAARNCMVDEDWCAKVADFGLSRDLYDRDYYRSSVKTQLPLKWMPPESIRYGRYNEKTDVWSYGIVCWEIMTRGAIPYPTVQAVNILEYLNEGKRMERPDCCPYRLHKVMKRCWDEDADRRPTFEELVQSTSSILRDAKQSMKRRSRSSEASSVNKTSNPYQNSANEKDERKPRPKPRATKDQTSNGRSGDYSSKTQVATNGREKAKERTSGDSGNDHSSNSSRPHSSGGKRDRKIAV